MAPPVPIIGIDPHKRSHTAVVLDDCEEIIAQLRVDASRHQIDQLLAWAPPHPGRVWAVENAHGMGHLLAQQLIGRGETVVDVPSRMAARARKLSGKSARKSDPQDARSVAHRRCAQPGVTARHAGRPHRCHRAAAGPPLAAGLTSPTADLPVARPPSWSSPLPGPNGT